MLFRFISIYLVFCLFFMLSGIMFVFLVNFIILLVMDLMCWVEVFEVIISRLVMDVWL